MKRIALALSLLAVGCATSPKERPPAPLAALPISYAALEGWEEDRVAEAMPVFLRSCAKLTKNPAGTVDFLPGIENSGEVSGAVITDLCLQAAMLGGEDAPEGAARRFIETNFTPVLVSRKTPESREALFTGYFEPTYPANSAPAPGLVPVLTRPDNLITVDLGAFDPSLAGKRVAGQVSGNRLVPYATHQEIITAPPEATAPLAFMDPTDLLFLQIQGSGRLVMEDGEVMRVGYAAQNGHKYVPVGRTLVKDGALPLEAVSMQSIREWLRAAPYEDAARVRYSNPSYVFFTTLDGLPDPELGPLGAQGVQLTTRRSLAVDDEIYGYGLPVWLERDGETPERALYIAQDTGGAITGAQRADVFFGAGEAAGEAAGVLKAPGRMIVLLPNSALPDAP
ncbi:murein transglycosylase A [Parvularcula marina]|uniref:peptidoglycan lytic exotransglycosylase n=1 Tax=Parvularcula marina TaxID=2292771 RepID=A0A371RJ21_9PROT|nr:murein transglycosylase A [Parvularcula marina]RFB05443.1 murein transglycosylase [Parvularcula marina]